MDTKADPITAHDPILLYLDVGLDGNRVKISAYEQKSGEVLTTRYYESLQGSLSHLDERIRETVDTLNRANKRGRLTPELLDKLKGLGQMLRDELMPLAVKKTMHDSRAEHLILSLDEKLIHIPWELLHDGNLFLCQRFSMGRIVKTRNRLAKNDSRPQASPMNMMILSDPVADLPSAYSEGIELRDLLETYPEMIRVSFRSGNVPLALVKEKIRSFDLVHFAGHADYHASQPENSGWRFQQGLLTAKDIMNMTGTAHMPSLVFSNACQSGRSKAWEQNADFQKQLFGLADAFIYSGVRHYIGTFWDILDEPGKRFALAFYQALLSGASIGHALKQARSDLVARFGEETIVWASYLLYGDPRTCYASCSAPKTVDDMIKKPEPSPAPRMARNVRAKEDVIEFSTEQPQKKKSWSLWVMSVLAAGLLILGAGVMLRDHRIQILENKALAFYRAGEYSQALDQCELLFQKAPDRIPAYLITGKIRFADGDMDGARHAFETVVNTGSPDNETQVQALMGLARIASLSSNTDSALAYYRSASELAPMNWEPWFYQAVLLEQQGRYTEAGELADKARRLSPGQPDPDLFARDIAEKKAAQADDERKERISRLVKELLAQKDKQTPGKGAIVTWTSRPLTVWVADLTIQGFSYREGLESLIRSGISHYLSEWRGVSLVERDIMEQMLTELNLSASGLADPQNALGLGRLLAARLILTGRIHCSAAAIRISLRLIETETGQIVSIVNETYDKNDSADTMTRDLGQKIQIALNERFPRPE